VLKAREVLDHDERKRNQAISAHNPYIQIKAKERNGQIKRRTVKATTLATNPSTTDGRLPSRNSPLIRSKDGIYTIVNLPTGATPTSSFVVDNLVEEGDSRRPIRPVPGTTTEIMDTLESETSRGRQNDPVENARKKKVLALGRLTLQDHIERLRLEPVRRKCYSVLQASLKQSIEVLIKASTEISSSRRISRPRPGHTRTWRARGPR